jgi:hypothetical protein
MKCEFLWVGSHRTFTGTFDPDKGVYLGSGLKVIPDVTEFQYTPLRKEPGTRADTHVDALSLNGTILSVYG